MTVVAAVTVVAPWYLRWHARWFGDVPLRYWATLLGMMAGLGALVAGCWWWWEPFSLPLVAALLATIFDPDARWT